MENKNDINYLKKRFHESPKSHNFIPQPQIQSINMISKPNIESIQKRVKILKDQEQKLNYYLNKFKKQEYTLENMGNIHKIETQLKHINLFLPVFQQQINHYFSHQKIYQQQQQQQQEPFNLINQNNPNQNENYNPAHKSKN